MSFVVDNWQGPPNRGIRVNEPARVEVDTPSQTRAPELVVPPTPAPQVDDTPAQAAPRLTGVVWLEQPNSADYSRYYPARALESGLEGRATIECFVAADGSLSCTVISEDPPGAGFGEASLRAARHFRVAPRTRDGDPTEGGVMRRMIRWVMP